MSIDNGPVNSLHGQFDGDRLTKLLALQQHVCATLDEDPAALVLGSIEHQIEKIKDWFIAAGSELQEALDETGWKPWATSKHVNADAGFSELRDALQFIIDLMFAYTGLSPDRLADKLYREMEIKSRRNLERHAEGYDGVTGKCPNCGRSYDDSGTRCLPANNDIWPRQPWCQDAQGTNAGGLLGVPGR